MCIVEESANTLAKAKVCFVVHTTLCVRRMDSAACDAFLLSLSYSCVKTYVEARMAEMEANFKKACKCNA